MTHVASTPPVPRPVHHKREVYIDAFRGVMALLMVQGHVFTSLLSAAAQTGPLYTFQNQFHGSTAPGFLFASGFVAGLPRAPLSLRASARRARRLLFILGVGYWLHLPYYSLWKTLGASPAEKAALYACDALQAIAVAQLFVMLLQWIARARWTLWAGVAALAIIAASPGVWAAGWSARVHPALGAYLDQSLPSHFPLFPFAAFVLAGTVAGSAIGRQEPGRRHRRALVWGSALLVGGWLLSFPLQGYVDFWGPSPAYTFMRLGGLLLIIRVLEVAADHEWPGITPLALLGHETLQVFVLHLLLLYGGVFVGGPLTPLAGQLGFGAAFLVLAGMLPILYAAAWLWHRFKVRAPHEALLLLVLLGTLVGFQFLTRPW
jgi:uncharacterized membrane protein